MRREIDELLPAGTGAVGLDFGVATTIMPSAGEPIEMPARLSRCGSMPRMRLLTVSAQSDRLAPLCPESFETLPKRPARTIRPQHECLPHFPSRRASAFIPRQMVVVVALAKDSLEAARQPAPSRRTQAYALRGSGGMSAAGRAADRIDAEERHDLACAKGKRVSSFGTPPAADNKAVVVLVNENTTDVTPTASINPAAALVDRADSVPDEHKRDRLQGAKRSHSSGFGEHLQRGKCRFALITRRAGASNHSVSSPAGCQKTIHRWEEVCRQH